MNPSWQGVLSAVIVAAALVFAMWRLAPARLRQRLLDALEKALPPRTPGRPGLLHRWIDARRMRLQGGCANCAPGKGGAGARKP